MYGYGRPKVSPWMVTLLCGIAFFASACGGGGSQSSLMPTAIAGGGGGIVGSSPGASPNPTVVGTPLGASPNPTVRPIASPAAAPTAVGTGPVTPTASPVPGSVGGQATPPPTQIEDHPTRALPALPQFANSVFTVPLPANPQVAAMSSQMLASYGSIQMQLGGFDTQPTQFAPSPPIYWAKNSDPIYTIHCNAWPGNSCPSLEGKQIHAPLYTKWGSYPSPNCSGCSSHGNFDGHLVLISPDRTYEYDFWQADQFPGPNGGTWTVSSGEAFPISQYNEFGPSGWQGSATASDRALTAGVIWPSELLSGVIPHALILGPPCINGANVYPSQSNSGLVCTGNAGLPEGSRIQLTMSDAQIQALPVSSWTKMVYTAMAHYGVYVTDTSGGNNWYMGGVTSIVFTYTGIGLADPWPAVAAALGLQWSSLGSFSEYVSPQDGTIPDIHNYLRVIDPCVTQRTC